jgi:phosphopantetheinyl transferase (holo-ACP synthase)
MGHFLGIFFGKIIFYGSDILGISRWERFLENFREKIEERIFRKKVEREL